MCTISRLPLVFPDRLLILRVILAIIYCVIRSDRYMSHMCYPSQLLYDFKWDHSVCLQQIEEPQIPDIISQVWDLSYQEICILEINHPSLVRLPIP